MRQRKLIFGEFAVEWDHETKISFASDQAKEKGERESEIEQARNYLIMADEQLKQATEEQKDDFRDARYRLAFDLLFDAVRYAAMTFLVLDEQTRWSELPKKLPAPFNKRFREFISYLHVQFKYQGTYPKNRIDEAFQEWRAKVSTFIDELDARSQTAKSN